MGIVMGKELPGFPMAKINVKTIEALKAPGYHGIGDGLYLQITTKNARSWIYRYQLAGHRHDMGLGSAGLALPANGSGWFGSEADIPPHRVRCPFPVPFRTFPRAGGNGRF